MVQTSPSAHRKLSQDAVAEARRIVFATPRKGDDAPRENFSFFLFIVGQVEHPADPIKGNRHRFDVIRPKGLKSEKAARCSLFSFGAQKRRDNLFLFANASRRERGLQLASMFLPSSPGVQPEVGPNPYKPECNALGYRHSVSKERYERC